MDREDEYITEFHLGNDFSLADLDRALDARFPGSRVEFQNLVPDALPGYQLLYLHVSLKYKQEVMPFLREYASRLGADFEEKQNSNFPFNPLA